MGHRHLTVRRKSGNAPEEVELSVATGRVMLQPSRYEPAYRDRAPIECAVVRVWEASPPPNTKPLEWLLCTSLPCRPTGNLLFVAEGYSLRWMVEELHKCAKTGCQVEMRRPEHVDRLEPLIGLLSVLSVWLRAWRGWQSFQLILLGAALNEECRKRRG